LREKGPWKKGTKRYERGGGPAQQRWDWGGKRRKTRAKGKGSRKAPKKGEKNQNQKKRKTVGPVPKEAGDL